MKWINSWKIWGTSLVVRWLRLWASNARGVGSIPGWGTKISHAARHGQKKKEYHGRADWKREEKAEFLWRPLTEKKVLLTPNGGWTDNAQVLNVCKVSVNIKSTTNLGQRLNLSCCLWPTEQWLSKGLLCSMRQLVTSADIPGCHSVCVCVCVCVVGGCCHPSMHKTVPIIKNYLASSVALKLLCCRGET